MASSDTHQRIMDAAERLFAERGYAGASMRRIVTEAGVHLAAVNYHFGSKRELFGAVLERRLRPLNQQRIEALADRTRRGFERFWNKSDHLRPSSELIAAVHAASGLHQPPLEQLMQNVR